VAMEVDIEIGGADQTFNMLTGRMLSKAYLNKEKFVRANRMMNAPDAKTMSKTKGNGINLADSPEDMYGKAMSYADDEIINGFELLTEVPMEEVKEIDKTLTSGANPMEFKKRMAFEIVKIIKGQDAAERGQAHFEKVIQSKDKPEDMEELNPSKSDIITVLVEAGFVKSTTEARQNIKGGGVKINDEKVENIDIEVKSGDVVQKGKRFFVKIK